jgi:hypothetical protein
MAIVSWTLGLLLLSASPAQASEVVSINKRNFKIPIVVDPTRRPELKLLKLFVSTDQGESWAEAGTRTPDQDHFAYFAQADGLHWFTVAIVDQQDRQLPPDPYKVPPNQKILVDTVVPDVKIRSLERHGEEVAVAWEIKEDHANLESLKLEYRPADAPAWSLWYAVPVPHKLTGDYRWRVESSGALTVRLEMKDEAGNVASVQKELPAAPAGERLTTAAASPGPAAGPPAAPAAPPASSTTSGSPLVHSLPGAPAPLPGMDRSPLPAPGNNPSDGGHRVVAWSPNTDPGPAAALPGLVPARGSFPNALVVNDLEVSLQYELKFGPSGVIKVEVWLTDDEGRTWKYWTEDEDRKSPVVVKLPREGVYGFRLVTTSGANLSEGPPQSGDAPDLRIEVDSTPPAVQLYEPKPDSQRPETLVLSWTSSDRNLTPRPVTIEYAKPEGTWQPIAANQPATGSLSWSQPEPLSHVLLRVTAVDTAGNRSVAETPKPLLVDHNKTKGRILGIAPVRRPASERPDSPPHAGHPEPQPPRNPLLPSIQSMP